VGNTRLLLLDLGNVLLEFSHLPIGEALARNASVPVFQDPKEVIRYLFKGDQPAEAALDEGKVSAFDFYEGLRSKMGLGLSFEEFSGVWNSIFLEKPGAGRAVELLKGKVGLHLLSNTNVLHFQHCLRQFPWLKKFDSFFLSYEMGVRKPDPAIYKMVLARVGSKPEEILYLDDIPENLVPAQALGIRTELVGPTQSLIEVLKNHFPFL
jgi:FMN phosphatase YigB (HAD superfamily)